MYGCERPSFAAASTCVKPDFFLPSLNCSHVMSVSLVGDEDIAIYAIFQHRLGWRLHDASPDMPTLLSLLRGPCPYSTGSAGALARCRPAGVRFDSEGG